MVITPLDQCVQTINLLAGLAKELNPNVIVLCHGGPIVGVKELRYLMERCEHLAGFYGASTIERIPVEAALAKSIQEFQSLSLNKGRN